MTDPVAGRELDALVAERVFAATADHVPHDWPHVSTEDGVSLPALPSLSTSIADAWRVVERMADAGWYCDITSTPHANGSRVTFWKSTDDGADSYFVRGKHPEAICRAALAALEDV